MTQQVVRSARAVTIGDELLTGKVRDQNSFELARTLFRLGISLDGIELVPDRTVEIRRAVAHAVERADVVFTSGGVGPTHDDVTLLGVAEALGRALSPHPGMIDLFTTHFGPSFSESHRKLALLPEGAMLLQSPGLAWPVVVVGPVWLLPGVPEFYRAKMETVANYLVGPSPFFTKSLHLTADELTIKSALERVVLAHPEVAIGSYPKWRHPVYKTRVTLDSRDAVILGQAFAELEDLVRSHIVEFEGDPLDS